MKSLTQLRPGRGGRLATAIATIAAMLVLVPAASAASDPLAGGATTIELGPGFLKKTGKRGVQLTGLSPATVDGSTVVLPVSGGGLDPLSAAGTVVHAGELKFKHGKRTARVGGLVLDTANASLYGTVVGKAVRFASVQGFSYSRNGFGVDLGIETLALTGTAAKLLNAKLGFARKGKAKAKRKGKRKGKRKRNAAGASKRRKAKRLKRPFAGKQRIGLSRTTTQPLTVTILPTGEARLAPDIETATKLFMAGATTEIVPPAEFDPGPPPVVTLPISGGLMAPSGSFGVLQTLGGQKISKGSATTITTNLWLDLGLKATTAELELTGFPGAPGKVGRVPSALLDMSAASTGSDPAGRTISVANAIMRMTAEGATSFNTLYGTDFKAGDPLGSVSFTAQAQ